MNARGRHPSLSGRAVLGDRAAVSYADVREAYEDLEHALEHHEPLAATVAAFNYWAVLREALDG